MKQYEDTVRGWKFWGDCTLLGQFHFVLLHNSTLASSQEELISFFAHYINLTAHLNHLYYRAPPDISLALNHDFCLILFFSTKTSTCLVKILKIAKTIWLHSVNYHTLYCCCHGEGKWRVVFESVFLIWPMTSLCRPP